MSLIIANRKICPEDFEIKKWKLVFGRRKTGKTFFVKNFVKWDKYYFVQRNKKIIDIKSRNEVEYSVLLKEIELAKDKRIVIDEFHRLPEDFLDFLHSLAGEGADLILITSSLHFSKEILGPKSPLLGLVHPIRFSILSPIEILLTLSNKIKEKHIMERAVFLREPSLLDLFDQKKFEEKLFERIILFVPALIGEIFAEEDRKLTEVYEGVLYSIADGKRVSGEIARELEKRKLIKKGVSPQISSYLRTLETLDIIKKVRLYRMKKTMYHYYIKSAVVDLYYYIDAKYGILTVKKKEMNEILDKRLPFYLELFFEEFFSEILGMHPVKISKPNLEIDIALMRFQKLKLVGEVKWKNEIDRSELKKVEEKLNKFKDCRKILIVPEKEILPYEPEKIEVWDVKKILKIIKEEKRS